MNKEGEEKEKKNPKGVYLVGGGIPCTGTFSDHTYLAYFFPGKKINTFGSLDRAQFPPPVSPAKQKSTLLLAVSSA